MPETLPWENRLYPVRRPALLAGVAAVAGCAVPHWLAMEGGWQIALAATGCLLMAVAAFSPLRRRPLAGLVAGLSLVCLFAAWAGWRLQAAPDTLATTCPGEIDLIRLRGVIVEGGSYLRRDPAAFEYPEAPEAQDGFPIGADPRRNQTWLLEVDELPDLGQRASGFVKLYAPPETRLVVSSRVEVLGKLRLPRRAGNPGEVDSRARYRLRGISHTITANEPGQITVLQTPTAWNPARLAALVHEFFHERIGSRMPAPRAAVLGAALLGERGGLTMSQRQAFVRSGTVHLLVVSGLHVALLAAALVLLLRVFGMDPRWAWGCAGILALAYLVVTGIQPSSLRATTMVVIYALGHVLLRRPDPINVLGASALVSLAISPADVAELGFQLSYLAVLGILVLAPALQLARPRPNPPEGRGAGRIMLGWLGSSLRISIAVGLCTTPLLAYSVHVVSPIMLVTNLFAGPLLMLLLVLAMACPLALIPGVDVALAWGLSLLGGALEFLASFFAEVPGGHLFLPAPPGWWLVSYYATLAGIVLLPRAGLPRVLGALLWLVCLSLLPARALIHTEAPGPATLTALDVGQGQCVVIEVPQGPCVVLDCGSTSLGATGERVLAPYLWSRGRRHIDTLIISHADADHVNGLPQLLERFPVGEVLVSETLPDDAAGAALLAWLQQRATVRVLRRGDTLDIAPRLRLRCLWPDAAFVHDLMNPDGARNDAGLVLQLEAGNRRVLLPSDVEHRGFAGFMETLGRRGVDVMFAPHQGSNVTGLDGLLARLRPSHVVLSAKDTFPADEAMASYQASGAKLWLTWQGGAVTFTLGADDSLGAQPYLTEDGP